MATTNSKVYAVILAAGKGVRFGGRLPKQYRTINGKQVIEYTIGKFDRHPMIDGIVVVIESQYEYLYDNVEHSKPMYLCYGGSTGQESFHNALKYLDVSVGIKSGDIVIEHDGDRPLVDERIITDCVESAVIHGNGCTAIFSTDYIMATNGKNLAYGDHKRTLIRTQTPHAFTFRDIKGVYDYAEEMGIGGIVAPCDIIEIYKKPLRIVEGSTLNGLKITTKEDFDIIKTLIRHGRY